MKTAYKILVGIPEGNLSVDTMIIPERFFKNTVQAGLK
jgi:hypothetical protein